jgi:hypothetical protein
MGQVRVAAGSCAAGWESIVWQIPNMMSNRTDTRLFAPLAVGTPRSAKGAVRRDGVCAVAVKSGTAGCWRIHVVFAAMKDSATVYISMKSAELVTWEASNKGLGDQICATLCRIGALLKLNPG